MLKHSREDIPRSILAHPTIQMTITLKNLSLIILLSKSIRQSGIRPIGALGRINDIFRAGQEEDLQALETLEIAAFGVEQRLVAIRYAVAVRSHIHEMLEGLHRRSAEEVGEVGVCRCVELFV